MKASALILELILAVVKHGDTDVGVDGYDVDGVEFMSNRGDGYFYLRTE